MSWSLEIEVNVSVRDTDVSCCSRSEEDASVSLKIVRQVANGRCSSGDEVLISAWSFSGPVELLRRSWWCGRSSGV